MPKAKAKKKPPKAGKTAKRAMSYKDLQIAYLSHGVNAVEQLLAEGTTTKAAVRRALQAFQDAGSPVATLAEFVKTHLGQARRGRAAPLVGAERSYRAQKLSSGSTFLRLPLEALGVTKGGVVTVRFERDRIIVSKV